MQSDQDLMGYGRRMGWWHRDAAFRYYCNRQLFRSINLSGKRFLDIGCGNGRFCFWASVQGAAQVLGLEPSVEGSGGNLAARQFREGIEILHLKNIAIEEVTLQNFDSRGTAWDIVLLHASINHLDEPSCIRLREDSDAWMTYLGLARRLRGLLAPGGHLVIVDCARRNLFGDLGMRSPVARSIEWHKHQQPRIWIKLFAEAGFVAPEVLWLSFPRLMHLGVLMRNPVASYLTHSLFRLHMRAAN